MHFSGPSQWNKICSKYERKKSRKYNKSPWCRELLSEVTICSSLFFVNILFPLNYKSLLANLAFYRVQHLWLESAILCHPDSVHNQPHCSLQKKTISTTIHHTQSPQLRFYLECHSSFDLDRSQSLFYFVPQDSHSQAGSITFDLYSDGFPE